MEIGTTNKLKVKRKSPNGMYLVDESEEEVLLPNKYLSGQETIGAEVEVFVYNDSEDRLVATTENPKIKLNEFGTLKVVDVTKYGVFMDWGLGKDLLVPFKEQNKKMEVGKKYVVRMFLDEDTDRLIGSSRIRRFLSNEQLSVSDGEKVNLLVFNESELGFDVVINGKHIGLIYKNEVFTQIHIGDQMEGYVKLIRPDKKIDITLRSDNSTQIHQCINEILKALNENDGELQLSDKSAPQEIYKILKMSKKDFKRAIGRLYKQQKIKIEPAKIKSIN